MMKNDPRLTKSYCTAAFNHIYADMNGRYKLCCHARPHQNPDLDRMSSDKVLPFDYFLSKGMDDIRSKMLAGEIIPECESCDKIDEIKPLGSPRYVHYGSLDKHYTEVRNVLLKLRIFGSHCNLGCYMCFPVNSSGRRKELKEAQIDWAGLNSSSQDIPSLPEGTYAPTAAGKRTQRRRQQYGAAGSTWLDNDPPLSIKPEQWNQIKKHLLENIHLVSNIKITGGEPFLLPRHYEFLKEIPDEHAKHITLNYDTNLTTTRYKNYSSLEADILPRFRKVFLTPSADHFGEKLKWVRYPIDVEALEYNLLRYNKIINSIACTVSILNVYDLEEIQKYYMENFGLKTNFNVVHQPRFLSPRNIKDKKNLWKDMPGNVLQQILLDEEEAGYQSMRTYIEMLERNRNFTLKDAGYDDKYLRNIGYMHD